jgi:glutamine phosphoribosylpyrophosphate amidotransferase
MDEVVQAKVGIVLTIDGSIVDNTKSIAMKATTGASKRQLKNQEVQMGEVKVALHSYLTYPSLQATTAACRQQPPYIMRMADSELLFNTDETGVRPCCVGGNCL